MLRVVGKRASRMSGADKRFYAAAYATLCLSVLLVAYPLIYIVSASFSSAEAVMAGRVLLLPVDLSLEGYRVVFQTKDVLIGFRNSIFYTAVGTCFNVVMTLLAAYPFAKKGWPFKRGLMLAFTFTMIFSGGMIPSYLLMRQLGLLNKVWAMLLPGMISVYNMIITRTFMLSSIPEELWEASQLDGCDDFRYFGRVVLPLSKAVIAVITLYYAVGHWNAYFNAIIYLSNKNLFPLQVFLREILVMNQIDISQIVDPELAQAKQGLADLLKYALIVVATAPILCVYPFVQKYFIKGVMIGSIKG